MPHSTPFRATKEDEEIGRICSTQGADENWFKALGIVPLRKPTH
jgi:hypothetical protein